RQMSQQQQTIARNTKRRMMANCYYANKLRGGYFTEQN
ncbi:hypothetical protein KR038_000152, partial [Drosophila bunnanda]